MSQQEIRDNLNRLLGTARTTSDGRRELRDHLNTLLGHYDPRTNETRDSLNRLVGSGDILTTLLR